MGRRAGSLPSIHWQKAAHSSSRPIDQNFVTWPHLAAREAENLSFVLGSSVPSRKSLL